MQAYGKSTRGARLLWDQSFTGGAYVHAVLHAGSARLCVFAIGLLIAPASALTFGFFAHLCANTREDTEMQFVDLALVSRIEQFTAAIGRDCAQAAHQAHPERNIAHAELGGGIAVFTGVDSPLTQAVGIGLNGAVSAAELDRLEDFFFRRGADTVLEVAPYIDASLLELLKARPYRLEEFSTVLIRDLSDLGPAPSPPSAISVRAARVPEESELFTRTVAEGFAEFMAVSDELLDIVSGFAGIEQCLAALALVGEEVAGGGSAQRVGELGGLFGASTRPQFRKRGVQTALLNFRLAWLREHGCRYAVVITLPGSGSQRNFERAGFRPIYTRTKMVRPRE